MSANTFQPEHFHTIIHKNKHFVHPSAQLWIPTKTYYRDMRFKNNKT